jgi:hypothetical protein
MSSTEVPAFSLSSYLLEQQLTGPERPGGIAMMRNILVRCAVPVALSVGTPALAKIGSVTAKRHATITREVAAPSWSAACSAAREFGMSVADNFDQIPDAGYVRAYDSQAARRQFQVSLVLIVILAVAAFVLGILFRFEQPTETVKPGPVETHQVHFAGRDVVPHATDKGLVAPRV